MGQWRGLAGEEEREEEAAGRQPWGRGWSLVGEGAIGNQVDHTRQLSRHRPQQPPG